MSRSGCFVEHKPRITPQTEHSFIPPLPLNSAVTRVGPVQSGRDSACRGAPREIERKSASHGHTNTAVESGGHVRGSQISPHCFIYTRSQRTPHSQYTPVPEPITDRPSLQTSGKGGIRLEETPLLQRPNPPGPSASPTPQGPSASQASKKYALYVRTGPASACVTHRMSGHAPARMRHVLARRR